MRLTIVGANPQARGSECIVFGSVGRDSHAFSPVDGDLAEAELAFQGEWERRDMHFGAGEAHATALMGWRIGGDGCRTRGRLVVVSHSWSGLIEVKQLGRRYVVDLYAPATRLLLLDFVNEIMIDVTGLARADDGHLQLPALTSDALVEHVRREMAWFRFLERDSSARPGFWRSALERLRKPASNDLKFRLVAALLPEIAARGPKAVAPPPAPREDTAALRDQLRLLSAAVEGLARRADAKA